MPDIKTRDVVSGTIKAVDRSTLAGQRMKDVYVKAKDKAEHSVYSSESNSEEYAADKITDSVSTVSREAVHQLDVQGQRIIQGAQRKLAQRQENRQAQQSPPQSTQGSSQPSPNTPASTSPQTAQNTLGTKNIPNAQQPHRVIPDGAVTPTNSVDFKAGSGAPITKQQAIRNQQIASAKAELRAKRASTRFTAPNTSPTLSGGTPSVGIPTPAAKDIKLVKRTNGTIKQALHTTENVTIKASQRTIKTAGSTVKTVEHMGG
ncbi:MAG: hypothetical protein ACI3V4_05320, partial [Faecousia sp.]